MCTSAGSSSGSCATPLKGVTAISKGTGHGAALTDDGTIWTWERNSAGQLGNNDKTDGPVAVKVCAKAGASAGSCASYFSTQ